MNTPCYQCPRRAVNCHSRCLDYAQYRKLCDQISAARDAERRMDSADAERGDKIRRDVRKNGLYNQRKGRKRWLILAAFAITQLPCMNVTRR